MRTSSQLGLQVPDQPRTWLKLLHPVSAAPDSTARVSCCSVPPLRMLSVGMPSQGEELFPRQLSKITCPTVMKNIL